MDAFVGAVSDVIKKGVVYYTNLLAGSGSPSSKQKARGGGQNPGLLVRTGAHGCAQEAERNTAAFDIEVVAPNQVIINNIMDDMKTIIVGQSRCKLA
jgi:hypothetical protein